MSGGLTWHDLDRLRDLGRLEAEQREYVRRGWLPGYSLTLDDVAETLAAWDAGRGAIDVIGAVEALAAGRGVDPSPAIARARLVERAWQEGLLPLRLDYGPA